MAEDTWIITRDGEERQARHVWFTPTKGGKQLRLSDVTTRQAAQSLTTPSGIRTWRYVANAFGAYGYTGYTFALTLALEAPFTAVRLLLANASTSATWSLDRSCVAPSAYLNDGFTPLDASGASQAFTNVTTNNAGADGYYPSPSGSTTSLTVPVASAAGVLGWAATDWAPVVSLPRLDGGASLPLLMARGYASAAPQGPSPGLDYTNSWPSVNQGRIIQAYRKSGDCVTTPANFTSPGTGGSGDYLFFAGVQTYQQGRGFNIMALGDSLTQGYRTTADANDFLWQACMQLSTPTRPYAPVNCGWQGQTAAQFFARGYTELSLLKPDVVVIATGTPNGSPTTQAAFSLFLTQAMAFADACVRAGAIPILQTAVPFGGYNSAADKYRQANNTIVRALGASGAHLVLDSDLIVSDGAQPQSNILPQYLSPTDSLHLNDAGHAAIAAALVPILASVVG